MQWDARGRLAEVQRAGIVERYTYRYSGARAEKITINGDKTTVTRTIAADVEERDGKLIRYLSAFGKVVRLDQDETTPASADSAELPAVGAFVSPDTPDRIAEWYASLMAGLFCLFVWLHRRSACRGSITQRKRAGQWAIAMRGTVAASLLVFASCGGGAQAPKYSHAGDLVVDWPGEAELTLRDHLGSGVAVVDGNAEDRFQRSYHPYGRTRSELVADLDAGSTTGQSAHFLGNDRDVGAELGHFHARPYDFEVGRFLGPDPLRLFPKWGQNASTAQLAAYNYTAGNPIGFLDADGLDIHNYDMKQQGSANAMSSAAKVDEAGDWTIYERSRADNSTFYSAHQGNNRALHLDFASDIKTLKGSPGAARWKFLGNRMDAQGLRIANMLFAASAGNGSAAVSQGLEFWQNEHTVEKYLKGIVSFGLNLAGAAAKMPVAGQKVYRVYGGDAKPGGASWSPVDPRTVSNFRNAAGLPSGGASGANNSGRFVIEGTLQDPSAVVKVRSALPLDGNAGGVAEYVIPNPIRSGAVTVDRVSGVNPEF
jgi:RHS repeat-associated protein